MYINSIYIIYEYIYIYIYIYICIYIYVCVCVYLLCREYADIFANLSILLSLVSVSIPKLY